MGRISDRIKLVPQEAIDRIKNKPMTSNQPEDDFDLITPPPLTKQHWYVFGIVTGMILMVVIQLVVGKV